MAKPFNIEDRPLSFQELLDLAEAEGIIVDSFPSRNGALALDMDGQYYIGLDPHLSDRDAKEALAHELGHCMTRGFYSINTPLYNISWIEESAIHWAYGILLPVFWVNEQFESGNASDAFELAELADVSFQFAKRAIEYYDLLGILI